MATIDDKNCDLSGDIIAIREEGKFLTDIFSIELKTGYPQTNFHQHLKKSCKSFNIEQFWRQSCCSAERSNKSPMLIYRKKGVNTIVGITQEVSKMLFDEPLRNLIVTYGSDLPSTVFFNFEYFFEILTPETIKGRLWRQ